MPCLFCCFDGNVCNHFAVQANSISEIKFTLGIFSIMVGLADIGYRCY